MVNVRKIIIKDPTPSVFQVVTTIKLTLWGMVEHISQEADLERLKLEEKVAEHTENEMINEMVQMGFPTDALPLRFGNTQKRKRKRNKSIEIPSDVSLHSVVKMIPEPEYSGAPRLENICLVRLDGMIEFVPAQVKGVGPSKPDLEYALVKLFGDEEVQEVKRSSLFMRCVSALEYHEIHNLIYSEPWDLPPPEGVHAKYWDQRYRLFSKFDGGIRLDAESYYSVTPEAIAVHIAEVCQRGAHMYNKPLAVILDCFSGCGGNSVALASTCKDIHVVSVEIDPEKAHSCRHNALVYGVADRIDIICADVYDVLSTMETPALAPSTAVDPGGGGMTGGVVKKAEASQVDVVDMLPDTSRDSGDHLTASKAIYASTQCAHQLSDATVLASVLDVIVMSPPWGGPEYSAVARYDLRTMIPSGDLFELTAKALRVCSNVVLIVPRNTHKDHIEDLTRELGTCAVVEDMYMGPKVKMSVIYLGPMFRSKSATKKAKSGRVSGMARHAVADIVSASI